MSSLRARRPLLPIPSAFRSSLCAWVRGRVVHMRLKPCRQVRRLCALEAAHLPLAFAEARWRAQRSRTSSSSVGCPIASTASSLRGQPSASRPPAGANLAATTSASCLTSVRRRRVKRTAFRSTAWRNMRSRGISTSSTTSSPWHVEAALCLLAAIVTESAAEMRTASAAESLSVGAS